MIQVIFQFFSAEFICLLDFKGRFLTINNSGCNLIGFKEADILYHRVEEFVHSDDKGIFTNEVMQLKKEEATFKFENRCITKSGEIIWLSWYCNTSLKEGIIYATAKNITEEKKLRELNSLTRNLAKIGSWEVELLNQSVYWSDEVHQIHETNSKLFVPTVENGINFYREDFHQMVQSKFAESIATGAPFDFEAMLVTAEKKEKWVRVIGNTEFTDGVCTRIYGSFQDIHNRKEAEISLYKANERFEKVTEATNDAIWDWDIVNKTYYRSQEIILQHLSQKNVQWL